MPEIRIRLSDLIVDPDIDIDLLSMDAESAYEQVRQCYEFLPDDTEIRLEDDTVVVDIKQRGSVQTRKQYDRAVGAAEQGRYRKAIELFEKVLSEAPADVDARRNLAMAHLESGDIENAKKYLLQSVRLNPKDAWIYLLLGNLYARHEKSFEKAKFFYDRAYEHDPNDPYLMTSYGAMLANEAQYEEARDLFVKAIEINRGYPNAYCGLALVSLKENKPTEALEVLDRLFSESPAGDSRNLPVFEEARSQYLEASKRISESSFDDQMQFIEDRRVALEKRIGIGIEIEENDSLENVSATAQLACNYGRDHHLIKYRNRNRAVTPYLIAHEMEHIALVHFARESGKDRSFITTEKTRERATRSIGDHVYKLQQMGVGEDGIVEVMNQIVHGIANQIFNCPIDMIVEYRLFKNCPELRHSQFVGLELVYYQETLPVLVNPEIKQLSPRSMYNANLAYNCALAIFTDHLYQGKTDYAGPYRGASVFARGEKLFNLWQKAMKGYEPGDEYALVDEFAGALRLQDWYEWRTDAVQGNADRSEGVTNPELLQSKEPAAVMYCVDALKRFSGMPGNEIAEIAGEIGLLGQNGIDYASPDRQYTLRSIPGAQFSGLHLMCLMYVGFQRIDPSVDVGMDLADAYRAALALYEGDEE